MLEFNEEYANKAKLNDLHYTACSEYTSYCQSGLKGFKERADQYYKVYKDRGGKKELRFL